MRDLAELDIADGTRVLVRADLNVPIEGGVIQDELRIDAVLPTLRYLRERGGVVVVCSHLGRPQGEVVPELSLAPVAQRLAEKLGTEVRLQSAVVGPEVEAAVAALKPGDVTMLENLRFEPGEEADDPAFAEQLARLADVYVNDAFGVSHRAAASVVGVCALLPHAPGLLVAAEVKAFERILVDPPRPFVAILGGAKVSDKLGVIDALLDKVDVLLVGGAMAFTFARAEGGSIGASLCEDDRILDVKAAVARAAELGKELLLPEDVVCATEIASAAETRVTAPTDVPDGWMGLDVGPRTVESFAARIASAGSVLWNGPMGVFETPPFDAGTRGVAEAFASTEAFTVAGGGDSAAALRQMGLAGRIDHLSTGGGASLEYIEAGDLPGLAALRAPDPT
ncbi:MAG: phosphoglycerate kinase [Acidimicrobiia bacterium]|nr:phosphoglycerate kinase [Acidimicrobiia bacterium]